MEHTTRAHVEGAHQRNFERHAMQGDRSDCWQWGGSHSRDGYAASRGKSPLSSKGATSTGGHRVGYLLLRGDIPEGLVLDHLCRNRWCVNPWHLEIVTSRVNTLRQRVTGMCRSGLHEMTDQNVREDSNGHRRCHACNVAGNAARMRRWRANRAALAS